MPTYFTTWCPLGEECSKKRKMLCKFESEDKVRDFLYNHLVNSSYHLMENSEAEDMATTALVEQWEEEEESTVQSMPEAEQDLQEPALKRKRSGKGKDKGKAKGREQMTKEDITQAVAEGMESGLARIGQQSTALLPRQGSSGSAGSDEFVRISRASLMRCCDSIQRAEATCLQSSRVASCAVNVFEKEAANLQNDRRALQELLRM